MRALGMVIGVLLVLVGVIWILQGFNVIGGSAMSGRPIFSILGAVLVLAGVPSVGLFPGTALTVLAGPRREVPR